MRIVSLLVAFVLVGSLGCTSDLPTTPDGGDDFLGKAAQDDRSEWQLMMEFDIAEGEYANGILECLNDGLGEDSWWAGKGAWYVKTVSTPSGNQLLNLKYEIEHARMVGMETGEVWHVYRYNSHFHQHTRRSDGYTRFHQPDHEWFVNDEGEKISVLWLFDITYDQDFNVVSDRSKVAACVRM